MGLQRLYHRLIVLKRNLNLVMHKILRKTLKYLLWLSVNVSVIVSMILFIAVVNYVNKLPPIEELLDDRKRGSVTLLDRNNEVFAWRGNQFGGILKSNVLNPILHDAIISVEDRTFYSHYGVSLRGILGAIRINLREGRGPFSGHGGSTITQQVAKILCLLQGDINTQKHCRRSTISRKLLEIPFALALEYAYSKKDILSIYINRVYLGSGAYGFEAASERYFNKSSSELSIGEAALLAGLLKAPTRYSPINNKDLSQSRALTVLKIMRDQKQISITDFEKAVKSLPIIQENNINEIGSYYADWVMQDAPQEITTQSKEDIIIRTYFDPKIQKAVDNTILSFLETEIMSDSKAQIAIVVMSADGHVRAMSGGRPSEKIPGQFNRAYQAKRQPGSAFKPFVYGAALDIGISPNTILTDEPVTIMFGENNYKEYSPKNYDNKYLGPVTIEEAFSKSLNTVAVKVGTQIGINRVKTLARELGIETFIPSEPSIALGSSEVNLLELTTAYAGILNNGTKVYAKGWRDLSVKKSNEIIIKEGSEQGFRVFSKLAAQTLKYLMFSSVETGTGKNASVKNWQIAGKTGTSQSFRDAWFVGFSTNYVIGVWMGNDDNRPLKNVSGGGLPAKIFSKIMTKISFELATKKEIAMVSPDQFDTLSIYENPAAKFQIQSQDKISREQKNSSLIGGLIRALLWGD
ncbi:MAG: glycosyl transferase family 51 [Paracoccaceae bacterium]|nr:MAG: glycosyl transferase family 51 [Paracoccaceae bacterium]